MSQDDFKYMDAEEKELIESIENLKIEELKPAKPDIKKKIERAAMEYRRSHETKMNIRIDRSELERIKKQASREGLKYQTFIKSILHKYITGQLKEDKHRAG